jgi:undecaprenyl-phosphate galactose phosphotransferase
MLKLPLAASLHLIRDVPPRRTHALRALDAKHNLCSDDNPHMNRTVTLAVDVAGGKPRLAQYAGLFLFAADFIAIAASALLANTLHYWVIIRPLGGSFEQIWSGGLADQRVLIFAVLILAALTWFSQSGHYSKRRPFWDEVAQTTRVLAILAAADAITLYLLKLPFSRFWFLTTWALAIALIPILRALTKDILIANGIWQKAALILGTGHNAVETARALRAEPMMGLEPVALLSYPGENPAHPQEPLDPPLPVLPLEHLGPLSNSHSQRLPVFVALDDYGTRTDSGLIRKIRASFRDIRIVPPVSGFPLYGAEVHHLFRQELFFLTLRNNLGGRATRLVKRTFDALASAALLVLLSPLFLYLVLRIKVDGGPAFFAHPRIGVNGTSFRCYKFRSMVPNAAEVLEKILAEDESARREWEDTHKLKDDPRVTKVGAFLRRTSLDELPQLWNVLIGEMSLVGPRPIVQEELERYGDDAFYYLESRPGITGVWQVSGRSDTDYAFRVYLDSWYVKNWSLWYDIIILIKTVRVVLNRAGAY